MITYSTKPMTLGEARLIKWAQDGDFDAAIKLLMARTNLTEAEAEALDASDLAEIMQAIADGMNQGAVLAKMAEQLKGKL